MNQILQTIRYAGRNGVSAAYYAARERLESRKESLSYTYEAPSEEELLRQKREVENLPDREKPRISILVPAYETDSQYLTALLASVFAQTYDNFELVIADASVGDRVEEVVKHFENSLRGDAVRKLVYKRLYVNEGISGNSNEGLKSCRGDYVALLDHDDLLTEDALYEMVKALRESDMRAQLVYSDEDKCDENGENFNTPHYKLDFNLDLFLTNNYICHFTMIKTSLIQKLRFRKEYDGAQDYDLFLRVLKEVGAQKIAHAPKILYHWRCHSLSTASNPASKEYAYEAGRKALTDYYRTLSMSVMVKHSKHQGFYDTFYLDKDIFLQRTDIAAVGGPITEGKNIVGGAMTAQGDPLYGGLNKNYSGYMNRADLCRDVEALDLRNIRINPELSNLVPDLIKEKPNLAEDVLALSLAFSKRARERGYLLLYSPKMKETLQDD